MAKQPAPLEIRTLPKEQFIVTVVGLPGSDILTHKFPIGGIKSGLNTIEGTGTNIERRPKRVPWKEMLDAMYITTDGFAAFKSDGFKAAIANATILYGKTVTKKLINRCVFVWGEHQPNLIEIYGECYLSEEPAGIGQALTQIRYRPGFKNWWANLVIEYYPTQISKESVLTLLQTAGDNIGVAEMRPDKCGKNFGRFTIADKKMIKTLKKVNNWRKVVSDNGGPKNISLERQRVA